MHSFQSLSSWSSHAAVGQHHGKRLMVELNCLLHGCQEAERKYKTRTGQDMASKDTRTQ